MYLPKKIKINKIRGVFGKQFSRPFIAFFSHYLHTHVTTLLKSPLSATLSLKFFPVDFSFLPVSLTFSLTLQPFGFLLQKICNELVKVRKSSKSAEFQRNLSPVW
jgi:hypothetical protein